MARKSSIAFKEQAPPACLKLTISSYQDDLKALLNLKRSREFQEVHITGAISDDEVDLLCREVLLEAKSLERVTLTLSECSDIGAVHIGSLIEHSSSIKHLSLLFNNVGEKGAMALSRGLSQSSLESFSIYATQLDLHDCSIGDTGTGYIADAVKNHKTLHSLAITQNGVTNLGLGSIITLLESTTLIADLDLSSNHIDSKGAKMIGSYLRSNVTLKMLNLNGNHSMGCEGAKEIAISLCQNSSLEQLGLRSCGIGKKGAERFAMTLRQNSTLKVLDLCGNTIVGDDAVELISRGLKENRSLLELNLSSCGIGDEGCAHLADTLLTNATLTHLWLQKNEIGDGGIVSLSETLKHNSVLCLLSVTGNRLSHKGSTALIQSLSHNSTLTTLSIDGLAEKQAGEGVGNFKSMVDILLDKNRQLLNYKTLTKKLLKNNRELAQERDALFKQLHRK